MSEFRDYVCEYPFDGTAYGITICARSEREAKERMAAMARGVVNGELVATVPAAGGAGGVLVRAACAIRNWFA